MDDDDQWASILSSSSMLACLAAGSVALSRIQLTKKQMDGALQYVLVARQDAEDIRAGDADATDRVESALVEASRLLRDVARELHPEVAVLMIADDGHIGVSSIRTKVLALGGELDIGCDQPGTRIDDDGKVGYALSLR
ncbi:hypothetical protein [Mycobacterium sp. NPDC006124]|uniref:hypothetical protein n=1 Tax=Mycobacterium sp. NPDC006124 TaxID=3156729 RepID=UPI00339E786E